MVIEKGEPQNAADYDDRTTAAVKSVLVEIGQLLGSYRGKFALVGGAVPWLLLGESDMPHVGTLDIDLSLDADALGDGEYAQLVDTLRGNGYHQREGFRRFQLVRTLDSKDDSPPIDIIVDFLRPMDTDIVKNVPPLISEFAVMPADGADLALKFYQIVAIDGEMPTGGTNRVEIAVCSIPALLAMKGHALNGRHKQKDAYDVYYSIRNFPGGTGALAEACKPILDHPSGMAGYGFIAAKFDTADGYGATSVRNFVAASDILGDRSEDEWQQDAFGQVDAWLRAIGMRG